MPNEAYWERMDREEKEIGTKRAQDALDQGKDIEIELRVFPPDGDLRWIAVRGRARNGGSESIIGISYDITERKEQEKALREYQEWLPAILDQLPGGVGLFDKNGVAVIRGGPLARLWADALPSEDPTSRARWRSFDASGRPLPFDQYPGARALRGEIVSPGTDFLYTGPDRREHWYRVSSAPFRDETGAITGATVFIQDVDKEKRADERLRQSEERLNAAVELAGTRPLFRGNQWRRRPADVGQSGAFPVGAAARLRDHLRHVGKRHSRRRPRARSSRRCRCLRSLGRWRLRCRISGHRSRRRGAMGGDAGPGPV